MQAVVDGEAVYIGKDDLFSEIDGAPLPNSLINTVDQLEKDGRTTMIVRWGNRYLGVIGLMDTPREAAEKTLVRLRDLGIRRMVMISGDNQRVAEAIAKQVGLDEARGDQVSVVDIRFSPLAAAPIGAVAATATNQFAPADMMRIAELAALANDGVGYIGRRPLEPGKIAIAGKVEKLIDDEARVTGGCGIAGHLGVSLGESSFGG